MATSRKSFDGLRRYRKRLLSPFSAMQADLKRAPFVTVSWADDGAAELLWLCCLLHRHGVHRCAPLVSIIAGVALTREMSLRSCFLFFSRLSSVDRREFEQALKTFHDRELAASFLQIFSVFQSLCETQTKMQARHHLKKITNVLKAVVRVATDRESRLALEAMALFLKCELESEALVIATTKLNPDALRDYPNSLESKMTAGLLRAHMNGMLGTNLVRSKPPFCERLWPALAAMEDCL